MVGIWLGVSVWLDAPCLWMTVFAAVDIALMLRLTGAPAGWPRFIGIFLGTAIIVLASQWLIAANAFGLVLGLLPHEAALQVGPVLVWEFSRLRISRAELVFLPVAIIFAWYFGLRGSK